MVVSLCKTSSHDTTVSLATNFRSRGNWLKSTGWLRYSISKIVDSLNLRMFWPHTRHRTPSFMGSHPNANGITIINTHNFSIFIFTSFQRVVSPGHRCLYNVRVEGGSGVCFSFILYSLYIFLNETSISGYNQH